MKYQSCSRNRKEKPRNDGGTCLINVNLFLFCNRPVVVTPRPYNFLNIFSTRPYRSRHLGVPLYKNFTLASAILSFLHPAIVVVMNTLEYS